MILLQSGILGRQAMPLIRLALNTQVVGVLPTMVRGTLRHKMDGTRPPTHSNKGRTMGGTLVLVDGLDEIGTIPVVDGTMIVVGSNTVDGNTQDSMDVMMDVAMGSDTVDGNTLDNVDVMMDVATVVGRMVDGNAIPADGMMDMAGMDTSNGMLVARPPGRGLVAVPLNNAGTMFALIGEVVGRVTETGMVRAKGLVVLVGWLLHGREVRPVRDQVLPRHLMRRGVRVSPPRQRLRRVNKNQVDVDCRIDRVFPRLPLGFGSKGCGSSDSALSLKNANNEAVKGRYALLDGRGCAPNGWMARLGRLLSLAEWIVAVPQRLGPALLLLRSWLVLTVPLVDAGADASGKIGKHGQARAMRVRCWWIGCLMDYLNTAMASSSTRTTTMLAFSNWVMPSWMPRRSFSWNSPTGKKLC